VGFVWFATSNGLQQFDGFYFSKYVKYLGWAEHGQNYTLIRYEDVLLMHSEALNELTASPDAEVVAGINLVRARAGVTEYVPGEWTKETFRDEIQNERNVEMNPNLLPQNTGW
jgi:hypothetical protein